MHARPSREDAHQVVYFRRHPDDDSAASVPGRDILSGCPITVQAKFWARLVAVATAPPHKFAGGGYWEAMKGDMAGWFEVRVDGPGRHHYRLFCLLDNAAEGVERPLLVVVCGLDKPFRTTLSSAEYAGVRELGREYLKRNPRPLA
ncbi:hypothetical protein F0L68_32685 [Solihabitans fulvus]|uniref:Uncharacterized protein n=1 Tax=Solihabitans fulvus TaxID=1892852 RepID=A0A5B2WRN8_9PSEU|nr:hypothetical protein F0L68_32685 [Solihabitans fulvus]